MDKAKLGNWLYSWVQESGEIYGFHNHSVWGSNPWRLMDYTSEHSTWSSPFLAGVAKSLSLEMNEEGLALLNRMLTFQVHSFQENSQYEHVGYQVGETLHSGLIHNAITNVSLLLTLDYGQKFLSDTMKEDIRKAVDKNLNGTMGWGGGRPCQQSCCNQDYARIWSQLLYQRLFQWDGKREQLIEDIDYMIEHFHVAGFPDEESVGTYRNITLEQNTIEPAEYYGLMINPLLEAYEQYGEQRFLDEAAKICNHIVRSSWVDEHGQRRLHKMYVKVGNTWEMIKDTMLISGMSMTLKGIQRCVTHTKDEAYKQFVQECHKTYDFYQTQRGYFVAASGWYAECDFAPCSAWQAHDFMYLMEMCDTLPANFWLDFFGKDDTISILLGHNGVWVEDETYWGVKDYFGSGLYSVVGRKDAGKFGVDIGWIPSNRQVNPWLKFEACPKFYSCEDKIVIENTSGRELLVDNITDKKIVIIEG